MTDTCINHTLCQSDNEINPITGLCVYCEVLHGKLEFKENVMCILCLIKDKTGVKFDKKCNHCICIDCFKKKYLFDDEDESINIFKVCAICEPTGK